MISRRTARVIAESFESEFVTSTSKYYSGSKAYGYETKVHGDALYDFLYDNDYPAWLLNQAKSIRSYHRYVQDWVMKLHTGETQAQATSEWTWEQRRQLGQEYLEQFAEDLLTRLLAGKSRASDSTSTRVVQDLRRSLELDGYLYRDGSLLRPESDVLDVEQEQGVLEGLIGYVGLANSDTFLHHLGLSEEHYIAGRWDDSVSNSRKFLEAVMQETAALLSDRLLGHPIAKSTYERPVSVRDFLEQEGLLESKEKDAIAKLYGLLSHTGSHPYMAASDQARLLRHLSLTLSQFVLLRLRGRLATSAGSA